MVILHGHVCRVKKHRLVEVERFEKQDLINRDLGLETGVSETRRGSRLSSRTGSEGQKRLIREGGRGRIECICGAEKSASGFQDGKLPS